MNNIAARRACLAGITVNPKLQLYLTGFWKRRIRPKARKNSQKDGGGKYENPAFTMAALTMMGPCTKRMVC
jgi:hypothetical protein